MSSPTSSRTCPPRRSTGSARFGPIRPGRRALRVSQDRLEEKKFLRAAGLSVARFAPVDDAASFEAAAAEVGFPAILKTRRFGYDGKGQVRLDGPGDGARALAGLRGAPAILEAVVAFTAEISVIAARGLSGEIACYDPGENVHRDGILRTTTVPARLPAATLDAARDIARKLLARLDYVGVIGVELFVTPRGLLVNEFAPRVHNSGHWTQDGCAIDQFEQHVRAVAGWPLGNGARHADVVMQNLIGDDLDRVPELLRSGAAIHLYGKAETRPGRKMGHVNRIAGTVREEHRTPAEDDTAPADPA